MQNTSPETTSGLWSRLYFFWIEPTLRRGLKKPLEIDSLLSLNPGEEPAVCDQGLTQRLQANRGRKRPLLASIWQLHRLTLLRVFGISLVHLAASLASPLLLRHLLALIGSGHERVSAAGSALALFLTALTSSLSIHHVFHTLLKLMTRIRSALVATLYRKALALTVAARQEVSAGQIINLMGTDAQKFVNAFNIIHSLWLHPLQLTLVLSILCWLLGPSALAGAAVLIAFLGLSSIVSRRHLVARRQLARFGDERIGLMNEILMSIRVIKFYAWERSFLREVEDVRAFELKELARLAWLSSLGTLIFLSTPVVVAVATFATFVLSGHALNAADVFSSLALFTVLRQAMVTLPDVAAAWLEANVAVQRLERFLARPELPARPSSALPPGQVVLANASFDWSEGVRALKNLSLTIEPGELVAVVGAVGSGKSALMSALLGDLPLTNGEFSVSGRLAYVSQQAWIQNDSIRNNILFGGDYDPERYQAALRASCLWQDIAGFPHGDATEIGERGVNLSGGQRQRISLARAIYHEADIVLLDDPLSALDNRVGKTVFETCIKGALAGRTRILATHRLEYISGVDKILVLDEGRAVEIGTPGHLKVQGSFFRRLWDTYLKGHTEVHAPSESESPGRELTDDKTQNVAVLSLSPPCEPRLVQDEERFVGTVSWRIYQRYLLAFAPGVISIGLLAAFLIKEALNSSTDSWLAYWSQASPFKLSLFLSGFLGLGLMTCTSTFIRSIWVALRGLNAGAKFHADVLRSVLRANSTFFESTPVGRVLNRFSRDMDAIDLVIPRSLHEALGCVFQVMTTVVIVVLVTPLALIAVLPIGVFYYRVQRLYRPTAREGQRLDSITRSPIFAQYSETLAGVAVLRAYGVMPRFEALMLQKIRTNAQAFYTSFSANRWLGTRIETLGASVVAAAALAAACSATPDATGFVGLAVTYTLAITGAMNWAVRMFSQLESSLSSVERISHYCHLPAEKWEGAAPPSDWPGPGHIVIDCLTLRYRADLPPVLRDISCKISPGEKIGIVGRTGAGKSSLLLGIYRVLEAASGRILIGGIDISTLELQALREALAIIPQDPVLFRGTIRKNLDPFARHSTDQLWDALERASLANAVRGLPGGLEAQVADAGSNFSVGQKQLLCLSRALLKKSSILLLDEATANVDVTTDALIGRALREDFANATVITIAHRLSTVMQSGRILVLEAGEMVEFDTPARLRSSRRGYFSSLLDEERSAVI